MSFSHWLYVWRQRKIHIHRRGPVPGTAKRRGGSYCHSYYKRPQTMSERRAACSISHDEEALYYGIYPRKKRDNRWLPDPWDDRYRGDLRNRKNWKQCRKNQWKS